MDQENSVDPVTALVVDDEKDICFFLNSFLKKSNLRSNYATSISEANKLLIQMKPDILFLDNHLPDGYGINIVRKIKEDYPSIKIVMISAYDSAEDKRKAFGEGVDHFLSKPFSLDQVSDILKNILGN